VKLRPLDDRIVVSPLSADEKTTGGIILPDSAKEKPNKGKVEAVGPGKMRDDGERMSPAVSIGAVVYYGKYAGTEIKVAGNEFKILRESDILAVEK
jgi:chaperonin GroES